MIEASTPSPQFTPEAPRAENTPSVIDRMGESFRQFATDVVKANNDAREQLGVTAVGHMLSGAAPFAVGIISKEVFKKIVDGATTTKPEKDETKTYRRVRDEKSGKYEVVLTEKRILERHRSTKIEEFLPGLSPESIEQFKKSHPILWESAENLGTSVLYNMLIARPSQGALPHVTPTDVGAALLGDIAAIKTKDLRQGYPEWKEKIDAAASAEKASPFRKLQKGFVDRTERVVGKGVSSVVAKTADILGYSSGPTVLGLRIMGEGVAALANNYKAILNARNHPNEPKPYRPPEPKPWERGDRGRGRDFRDRERGGRDRMYYGQGKGRYDRQHS